MSGLVLKAGGEEEIGGLLEAEVDEGEGIIDATHHGSELVVVGCLEALTAELIGEGEELGDGVEREVIGSVVAAVGGDGAHAG